MDFIEGKIREFETLSGRYAAEFSEMSAEAMDAKPGKDVWSVNECLDHVVQVNRSYFERFGAIAEGRARSNPWASIPFLPGMYGKMVLKSVLPTATRKSRTFPVWYPLKSQYGRNLASEVGEANRALTAHLKALAGKDPDRTLITSPAAGFVVYSLRHCLSILVAHQERHFLQAKRVKDGLLPPAVKTSA